MAIRAPDGANKKNSPIPPFHRAMSSLSFQGLQEPVQALTPTKLGIFLARVRLENTLRSPTSLNVLPTVTRNLAAAALSSVQQEVYAISTRSVNQLPRFTRTSTSV